MVSSSMLVCRYKLKTRSHAMYDLPLISSLTQSATKAAEDEDEAENPLSLQVGIPVDYA